MRERQPKVRKIQRKTAGAAKLARPREKPPTTRRRSPALPPAGRARSPEARQVALLKTRLDSTEQLLNERTVTLQRICDSTPWSAIRLLGALRRIVSEPKNVAVRERELHELAEASRFLFKTGTVISEDRSWSLIRILGAVRRMAGKGLLKGGWAAESPELRDALRGLLKT